MLQAFDPSCLTRWAFRETMCIHCGRVEVIVFPKGPWLVECECRGWTPIAPKETM